MVFLVVVMLVLIFLAVDVALHLRGRPSLADRLRVRLEESEAALARRVGGFEIAPDVAYHPGHTWARRQGRGLARVGVDGFASRLVGKPERLDVPPVGATVRAGRPFATLYRRGRRIPVVAPISGAVAAINRDVLANPAVLMEAPYEEGWLADIRSSELAFDFRSLMTGELARRFMDEAAAALHTFYGPSLPAAADGGEAIDAIGDTMDERTWDRVRRRFLLTDTE